MDRERAARLALLASEVKRTGTCARTGVPLSMFEAVLIVLPPPLPPSPARPTTTVLLARAEWDRISVRARAVAAAKGQAIRIIDGREFGKEDSMRQRRLKVAEINGQTHVELQSLLNSMREVPRLRDAADEIEKAVLRHQVWKTNSRMLYDGQGAELALAA